VLFNHIAFYCFLLICKYLDYLGYSKTISTFEDELKSLGKQSNQIIAPRNDSQKTEIQVVNESQ